MKIHTLPLAIVEGLTLPPFTTPQRNGKNDSYISKLEITVFIDFTHFTSNMVQPSWRFHALFNPDDTEERKMTVQ